MRVDCANSSPFPYRPIWYRPVIVKPILDVDRLDRFQRSMERCLADTTFLSRFYARFLLSSDEVARLFENTDMKKQAEILKRSLYLVLRAAHGLEDGVEHLVQVRHTHGSRGLKIGAHLYQHWLDTLLTAAEETDPRWDDELHEIWRGALQPCIDVIVGDDSEASGG